MLRGLVNLDIGGKLPKKISIFLLTFWSDRAHGYTEAFSTFDKAVRFSKRKKKSYRVFGKQSICETTLGVYRIRELKVH